MSAAAVTWRVIPSSPCCLPGWPRTPCRPPPAGRWPSSRPSTPASCSTSQTDETEAAGNSSSAEIQNTWRRTTTTTNVQKVNRKCSRSLDCELNQLWTQRCSDNFHVLTVTLNNTQTVRVLQRQSSSCRSVSLSARLTGWKLSSETLHPSGGTCPADISLSACPSSPFLLKDMKPSMISDGKDKTLYWAISPFNKSRIESVSVNNSIINMIIRSDRSTDGTLVNTFINT